MIRFGPGWLLALAVVMVMLTRPADSLAVDPFRLNHELIEVKEVPKHDVSSIGRSLLRQRDLWTAGRSDHFYVMGPNIRTVSSAVDEAEFAYAWAAPWIPRAPETSPPRSLLFLVNDETMWNDIVEGNGLRPDGLAMQLHRELYLKDDPNQNIRPDRIAHEVIHVCLYEPDAAPLPIWLEEGLANYLGWRCAVEYQGKRGVTLYRNLPALEEGEILPLEGLLALRAYPADPAATRAFYRQSEEWMALLAENIGADGVRRLIDRARLINVDQAEALREASGLDAEQMDELAKEMVRRCRQPLKF